MGVSNPARFGLCLTTKQTNFPMRFIPSVPFFVFLRTTPPSSRQGKRAFSSHRRQNTKV